jgi:hypothetical protein
MIFISTIYLIWLWLSVLVCMDICLSLSGMFLPMEAIALVGKENRSHNIMPGCHPHTPFTDIVRPIFLITFRRRPSFLKATTNQAIRKGSWRNEGCDGGGN